MNNEENKLIETLKKELEKTQSPIPKL